MKNINLMLIESGAAWCTLAMLFGGSPCYRVVLKLGTLTTLDSVVFYSSSFLLSSISALLGVFEQMMEHILGPVHEPYKA